MHLPDVQIISCVVCALLMVLVLYITIWKRQKYLWKDGIHLQDLSTSILSNNFIEFLLARDLNELKPISDSSNHFLMLRMSLILQTWLIKLTCFKSEDGTLIELTWQVDRKLKLNFLETLK